jgi:dihydrofolate synthase/folylpolyglutamate synthase
MSTSLEALLARLVGRGHRGIDLGLDRVRLALAALRNPHLAVPAIVVAGTNGKGSTCAMLESIALAAGVRVGMTTSPHLMRFSERIRVGGAPVADDAFAAALSRVLDDAPDTLTFFETLTCAAFVAFRDAGLDLAVLEVGLGGRLDATNVVPAPIATAITSIADGDGQGNHLEHANVLGSTVEAIAREKAGIFKRGVPAVIAPLSPRARREVLKVADEAAVSDVWEVMRSSTHRPTEGRWTHPVFVEGGGGGRARLGLPGAPPIDAAIALPGRHQLENAGVAASLAWLAGEWLPALRGSIDVGLARATWPARLERLPPVAGRADIWLDAAHNLDGARALAEAWRALGASPARTILVFGALADKAYEPVLRELATIADRRVYAGPRGRPPAPLEALAAVAPGEVAESPEVAIDRALAIAGPEDRVLVAGSIYLAGDVRAHVLGLPRDPAVGL